MRLKSSTRCQIVSFSQFSVQFTAAHKICDRSSTLMSTKGNMFSIYSLRCTNANDCLLPFICRIGLIGRDLPCDVEMIIVTTMYQILCDTDERIRSLLQIRCAHICYSFALTHSVYVYVLNTFHSVN